MNGITTRSFRLAAIQSLPRSIASKSQKKNAKKISNLCAVLHLEFDRKCMLTMLGLLGPPPDLQCIGLVNFSKIES